MSTEIDTYKIIKKYIDLRKHLSAQTWIFNKNLLSPLTNKTSTRFDVYETLCPQQMLVHKGGQIENWSGECRDIIPTKLQCQTI